MSEFSVGSGQAPRPSSYEGGVDIEVHSGAASLFGDEVETEFSSQQIQSAWSKLLVDLK